MRVLSALVGFLYLVSGRNDDQFNYDTTTGRDFGPEDWNQVTCDDVEQCLGWPDDWLLGRGWQLQVNSCRWCPADDDSIICARHHQSPINLERNRGEPGHPEEHECIDTHWMKYHDSSCTWQQLQDQGAFVVERHALRINQPLEEIVDNGGLRLACPAPTGRRFGRIDFSKGFADWWFLSHTDIKIPSEHTQNGKRYSAEVQMAHFYSVSEEVSGVDNEMATVSIFLQVHDDAPPYPYLESLICRWRDSEDKVREQCGLPSVEPYPGCWNPTRNQTAYPSASPVVEFPTFNSNTSVSRNSHPNEEIRGRSMLRAGKSTHDVLMEQRLTSNKNRLILDDINFREPDRSEEEWTEWIESQSADNNKQSRNLLEWDHLIFNNYQFLIDCKTEYYFRYSGTSTVPPCYGPFTPNSRGNANHWRVLKDPIRIHHRQLAEMERLMRERRAPSCEMDTAARVRSGRVFAARPLQRFHRFHFKTFCECKDWVSKWPEDRAWCENHSLQERLYEHPYNYQSNGF